LVTNTKNECPADALVRQKFTSIRLLLMIVNGAHGRMMAPVALSCRNTLVTLICAKICDGGGFGLLTNPWNVKQAPVISRSSSPLHVWVDGVAEKTTGALFPRASEHTVVRVNAPNTLLSPSVNVVVTFIVAGPPQHAAGNPVPGKLAVTGIVAVIRLQLTGVTLVSTVVESAIPSPFVSHVNVAAVVTVLPGRCSGTPVSASKP
jgi:hypothetical protein